MTAPATFVRHRTLVQALPIHTPADLAEAQRWLASHGVNSILGLNEATPEGIRPACDPRLIVFGPDEQRMTLTPGQWLVRDVSFGDFTVVDDADFTALHSQHVAVGQ